MFTGELHPCMFRLRSSAPMCSRGHGSSRVSTQLAGPPVGAESILRLAPTVPFFRKVPRQACTVLSFDDTP